MANGQVPMTNRTTYPHWSLVLGHWSFFQFHDRPRRIHKHPADGADGQADRDAVEYRSPAVDRRKACPLAGLDHATDEEVHHEHAKAAHRIHQAEHGRAVLAANFGDDGPPRWLRNLQAKQ